MTKEELGKQLKDRQYESGYLSKEIIDNISNDEIIDSYITCSCCGDKSVNDFELELAISMANSDEDFFRICDDFVSKKESSYFNKNTNKNKKR